MRARAIGSDFESLDDGLLQRGAVPPWETDATQTVFVETGRQALFVVADALSGRGYDRLLVPDYLCHSMVAPFQDQRWQIQAYGLTRDLRIPDDALAGLHPDLGNAVVLLASYFGREPDHAHQAFSRGVRARGGFVIEDETHRVFRPGGTEFDVSFASLRKLLPVGDGAYLRGDTDVLAAARRASPSNSRRWDAMDEKRRALWGDETIAFRPMMLAENERLEGHGPARAATPRTVSTLAALPYEDLARARRRNALVLRRRLRDIGVPALPVLDHEVPSHLVIEVAEPRVLQRALAAQDIFCAIHWPKVDEVEGISSWRNDLLSVPIDHRYDEADMFRVAAAIEREIRR